MKSMVITTAILMATSTVAIAQSSATLQPKTHAILVLKDRHMIAD